MDINERIKQLRKVELKITQGKFAETLGLSQANISNIEIGRVDVTERIKHDICSHFNVNPVWLETGDGDIFKPGKSDVARRIMTVMNDLPNDYWQVLDDIINRYNNTK